MEKETFDRIVVEFNALAEKTEKLRDFLLNKVDKVSIDNLNRDLLISQLKAMETYQGILSIRIGLNNQFNKENSSSVKDNENIKNINEVSE